jgi:hypothetical protein
MTKLYMHRHNGVVYSEEQKEIIQRFIVALCQMDHISESIARGVNANFIELTFD